MNPEDLAARRWRPLARAVDRREKVSRQLAEARRRVTDLNAALPAAEQSDRETRGRALADGKPAPRESEKARLTGEFEQAQLEVRDLEAAAEIVERDLGELRETNRVDWSKDQGQVVEKAQQAVREVADRLEAAVSKLSDEMALLAWVDHSGEASVDPYGGRLTHAGALTASMAQVRAAVDGIAAGQESSQPPPPPEPGFIERRLAARARPGWGG